MARRTSAKEFKDETTRLVIRESDRYDNARKESSWGELKTELVHPHHFATREQARAAVCDHITVFYNRQRLHSSRRQASPVHFEAGLT